MTSHRAQARGPQAEDVRLQKSRRELSNTTKNVITVMDDRYYNNPKAVANGGAENALSNPSSRVPRIAQPGDSSQLPRHTQAGVEPQIRAEALSRHSPIPLYLQ
jgi:hypothetical protein